MARDAPSELAREAPSEELARDAPSEELARDAPSELAREGSSEELARDAPSELAREAPSEELAREASIEELARERAERARRNVAVALSDSSYTGSRACERARSRCRPPSRAERARRKRRGIIIRLLLHGELSVRVSGVERAKCEETRGSARRVSSRGEM